MNGIVVTFLSAMLLSAAMVATPDPWFDVTAAAENRYGLALNDEARLQAGAADLRGGCLLSDIRKGARTMSLKRNA